MKPDSEQKSFIIPYFILGLCFLLYLVPYLLPAGRLWGFNHLLFLPPIYTVIFIALAVVALVIPWFPSSRDRSEKFAVSVSRVFFESSRKYLYRLIFVILCAGIFIIFPTPTHFLGDGYSVLANLASPSGTFYKWTERGITMIVGAVQSLFGDKNERTALMAFRTISVFSGIVSVWFFSLIAEVLTQEKIRRVLALAVILFSGTLLLFFGYVENYPLIWPALGGFFYFSLRYIKGGKGLGWSAAFLLFGLFVHFEMGIFVPAFVCLPFSHGRGLSLYKRHMSIFVVIIILLAAGAVALFVWKYSTSLSFENIFLPPFHGKPIAPGYSIFSLTHLLDIINYLFLLSPAIPLLIYFGYGKRKISPEGSPLYFLLTAAAGGLLFLFVIDPTLGPARDWDLFSICPFGLTLLLLSWWESSRLRAAGRLFFSISLYTFLATSAYLLVYLNEESSISRTKYLINLDPECSLSSMYVLVKYYDSRGNIHERDSLNTAFYSSMSNDAKIVKATNSLERGNVSAARELLKTIKPNRLSSSYHALLASIYAYDGDYIRALAESDSALELNPYNPNLHNNRANLFFAIRRPDSALACLRQGYKFNNRHPFILEGLSGLFLSQNIIDSAIFYASRLKSVDATSPVASYFLTTGYARSGRMLEARKSFNDYLRVAQKESDFEIRKQELEQLLATGEKQR